MKILVDEETSPSKTGFDDEDDEINMDDDPDENSDEEDDDANIGSGLGRLLTLP